MSLIGGDTLESISGHGNADVGRWPLTTPGGTATALRDPKTEAIAEIVRERKLSIRRLLVVGCGSGIEAAILARELQTQVVGIDVSDTFDPVSACAVDLRRGDATCLEFGDGSFDFLYSYHVLEHIPNYAKALAEMRRVLACGGGYFIGTPNRERLVGYLGSIGVPLLEKVAWNITDWRAMMTGRFRNEFGAHAGFSSVELKTALETVFGNAEEVTFRYYFGVYRKYLPLVKLLAASRLSRYLFPSVYFMGTR